MHNDSGEADPLTAIANQVATLSTEHARLIARLDENERRFRVISKGVLRVQEAERGRIARDLHDSVGQALTALKIQLNVLQQEAVTRDDPLAGRLADLVQLADRTLQEVRGLSHQLRPQMLDDLGLMPTLQWLVRTTRERVGIDVILDGYMSDQAVDPETATLIFRVAQEALTNAAKHSGASRVDVVLEEAGDRLRLRIVDDGRGFDVQRTLAIDADPRGFGLRGMRDRILLFGGRVSVRSTAGRGTTVELDVPLAPRKSEES
jgi:signal transduction histidine kinase